MGKGTDKFVVGEVKPFDQKNDMYKRLRWQSEWRYLHSKLWLESPPTDKAGHTQIERALENAGWYIEMHSAMGCVRENSGMLAWEAGPFSHYHAMPPSLQYPVNNPAEMSNIVKSVAKFAGADLVGICELDRRWLYSHSFDIYSREHKPLEVPPEIDHAVAIAVEMDYDMMKASPTCIEGAGIGMGYSRQAFTAATVAEFIRCLGYKAIPAGNDTALSVPIAIDAGLGEMGRHGQLITPKYGPRVRLSKVLTNMPMQPDEPVEFGVAKFCEACKKCAKWCPGQAITAGERTTEPLNISTSPGVLKWPIDAEKCLTFWGKNSGSSSCANCLRVCPFNKRPTWWHGMAQWTVKHTPWLDSTLVRVDDMFGFHKQLRPEDFWKRFKARTAHGD